MTNEEINICKIRVGRKKWRDGSFKGHTIRADDPGLGLGGSGKETTAARQTKRKKKRRRPLA